FGILPGCFLVAGREQYVLTDAVWPPVVADPGHARREQHVADASCAQCDHRLIGFDQSITSAVGCDNIGGAIARFGRELPILLGSRLAKGIRSVAEIVARAMR